MTLTDHLPDWLTTRLPADAAMGALRRKRPSLYWLIIATGAVAFWMVLQAFFYALALFPLFGGRAIVATLDGDPVGAAAWLALLAATGAFVVGVVYLAGRWAGEFVGRGEE